MALRLQVQTGLRVRIWAVHSHGISSHSKAQESETPRQTRLGRILKRTKGPYLLLLSFHCTTPLERWCFPRGPKLGLPASRCPIFTVSLVGWEGSSKIDRNNLGTLIRTSLEDLEKEPVAMLQAMSTSGAGELPGSLYQLLGPDLDLESS